MSNRNSWIAMFFLSFIIFVASFAASDSINDNQLVLQKSDSPLISFRILFLSGSAHDVPGKEGIASLTASMLTDASTQKNDYQKILELLFPMASGYYSQTDKEMTVIVGVTHKDNLMAYYALLRDAVISPAFKQEDFDRLKTDQTNYVAKTLRFSSDEELGKELLNQSIYAKHPYGHPNEGTLTGNQSLTLQDVKDYYQREFTRQNVVVGVAGNYTPELIQQIKKDFATLPSGNTPQLKLPEVAKISGLRVAIVEKKTSSTAFSMGFPLPFTRSDEDFYPMMIMNSWLGQHRTSVSHLYQVMREARGLNYGDYSYIEHFAFGGRNFQPPPNYARHQQIFQIWIRPVPNAARHFALRQAIRELQMLIDHGLTKEQFDATKSFLLNYIVSLAQSNSEQLGYALDDYFCKLPKPFLQQVKSKVEAATLEQVNSAIKKYLNSKNMIIAVVTEDAESFRKALVENTPSPMHYDSPKPDAILEEDKRIMNYPLEIRPENVTIIPVEKIFE